MRRPSQRRGTRAWWGFKMLFIFIYSARDVAQTALIGAQSLRRICQDQRLAGSVTVCIGGDRLWWTLHVAVGWYEGPDTPLSLTCLRIEARACHRLWHVRLGYCMYNVLTIAAVAFCFVFSRLYHFPPSVCLCSQCRSVTGTVPEGLLNFNLI